MSKILKITLLLAMFATSVSSFALQSSYYATESILSRGHWAKVKVTENGISQITYDQLRQAGFANPEKVTVYGYGGVMLTKDEFSSAYPDDLKQIYSLHTGDKILFYSEPDVRFRLISGGSVKIDRNYQANEGYYFITDSQPSKAPNSIKYIAYSNPTDLETHLAIKVSQPDCVDLSTGGARLFSENSVDQKGGLNVSLDVSDRTADSDVFCSLQVIVKTTKTSYAYYTINGVTQSYRKVGASSNFAEKSTGVITVSDEDLKKYDNKANLKLMTTSLADMPYCGYNYFAAVYNRDNKLGELPQLQLASFGYNSGTRYVLSDINPDKDLVWFVKDPSVVRPIELKKLSETSAAFTLDKVYSGSGEAAAVFMIAFDPEKDQYATEITGDVANQNVHGEKTPDMLIITTDVCEAQARRLADLHKLYDGSDVLVVNQRNLFNEFSSGTPSVMAYRRAAKMFYDRDPEKFKNLLIFGGGSYDNRFKLVPTKHLTLANTALTYQCMNIVYQRSPETNYSNDAYFGVLGDNYVSGDDTFYAKTNLMQIGVGRIPANTEEDARLYVDKVEKHLSQTVPFGAYSRIMVLADDGDSDMHHKYADSFADSIQKFDPRMTVVKVYDGFYKWDNGSAVEARRQIKSNLTSGVNMFYYTGHGKPDSFTAEDLWHRNYVNTTTYNYSPFAYLSTCLSFAFDRQDNNIVENMLYAPEGGHISVVASGRSVYADYNQDLAVRFLEYYSKATRGTTVGEIYRDARNALFSDPKKGSFARVNTCCYNLAGDPSILVDRPNYSVALTSVDGVEYDGSRISINPLVATKLSGSIVDSEGNLAKDFNGEVTIAIYEGPQELQNLYQDNTKESSRILKKITTDEVIVAEFVAGVVNGKFEKDVIVPAQSKVNVKNRIVIGATTSDGKDIALGAVSDATINNYDPEIAHVEDVSAPEITEMYINSPEFNDGDLVTNSAKFHARIYDESGVNVSSNGAKIKVVLDECKTLEYVAENAKYDETGALVIDYAINDLSDGTHKIKLQVSDVLGNFADKEISFTFVKIAESKLTVNEEPAKTAATLEFASSLTGDVTASLVIESIDGATVFTAENITFPYVWNLKNNSGEEVSAGHYRAFVKVASSDKNHTAAETQIIVVR